MKEKATLSLESKIDIKEFKQFKEGEELFRNTFEQAAVGTAHVGTIGNFIRI